MPTTKQAVAAIVRYIGLDEGRVGAVARALTDDSVLPPGAPGKSPDLSPQDVASLTLGAALDVPLRAVADTVVAYRALRLEGVPEGAPAGIRSTAGDELDVMAEIAATGSPEQISRWAKGTISVVCSWPEIAFASGGTGYTERFKAGVPGRWDSRGHRRVVEVNASAFFDVIDDLFGGSK
ncbi:MAG: hypothetical protein E5W91_32675 [Mesorhizobium sp.]|uniref:hypothetical protein n=1 Tax=Mesorhizobium sp. TaxID=1871066 RepID=UPI00121D3A45|nr:hypothetical protein [Mesorhizobium sp.]TIS53031.1 MAG: hypothetical protein E5W91_32675 [Mesorhizobium sp.]